MDPTHSEGIASLSFHDFPLDTFHFTSFAHRKDVHLNVFLLWRNRRPSNFDSPPIFLLQKLIAESVMSHKDRRCMRHRLAPDEVSKHTAAPTDPTPPSMQQNSTQSPTLSSKAESTGEPIVTLPDEPVTKTEPTPSFFAVTPPLKYQLKIYSPNANSPHVWINVDKSNEEVHNFFLAVA
jgi:hypothetical protein